MTTKRLLAFNVIIILLIIFAGFIAYYFYNQSTLYLKTDDAQITGQQIVISAPAAGTLTSWKAATGSTFSSGDVIGQIQVPAGKTIVASNLTMPSNGTVVQDNTFANEFVVPGTPLAYAYDMNNLWINANVKETQIQDVKTGQTVDIYVDAIPGVTLQGTVSDIGYTTASTFSLLPTQSTTADYTKVTQVIPVKITLQGTGINLKPGMSATVRIHR